MAEQLNAVERAARALAARDVHRGEAIPWEQWVPAAQERFRDNARATLAAVGAGEAVDREALATALHDAWKTADPESGPALYPSAFAEMFGSLADVALAFLAARGDAAPTEVEWGVRYGFDNLPSEVAMPTLTHAREEVDHPDVTGAVVIQRDVHRSAWREVTDRADR